MSKDPDATPSALETKSAPDLGEPSPQPSTLPHAASGSGNQTVDEESGRLVPSPATGGTAVPGYEIVKELGRGGMGIVYCARQVALKRLVALKRIRSGSDAGPDELARFRTEAEAVAHLQHPNIVPIYEVGQHEGLPYFSLEYVEGGTLAQRLGGAVQPTLAAAQFVETLARAMQYAHEHGVVHRDLKPANVLLVGEPDAPLEKCAPKIGDFGLAKRLDQDSSQTRSGAVVGTPNYMAPEQAQGKGKEVGPAADVWALGAILYEMLTGRPPFRGATVLETIEQVIHHEPAPVRKANRKVPRDLETICLKCLHKDPKRRYASAKELADDLERFRNFEPIRARRVGWVERNWRWLRKRQAAVFAAVILVLGLSGLSLGGYLWQQARLRHQAGIPTIDHFAEVGQFEDEPQPGRPLSEEEALRSPVAYRVYRREGQIEQIEVLNQKGRLLRHNPFHLVVTGGKPVDGYLRESQYRYTRDEGRVSKVTCYDDAGRVLWSLGHQSDNQVSYAERAGLYPEARSDPVLFEAVRGPAGELREVWRLDAAGRRVVSDKGVQGLRVESATPARTRLALLRVQGRSPEGDQPAFWESRLLESGNGREEAYFTSAGLPAVGDQGWVRVRWSLNDDGSVQALGLDARGQPAPGRDNSYSWRARSDDQGREIERTWFGKDGRPVNRKEGHARIVRRYDKDDQITETSHWVVNPQGNFVLRLRKDESGRTVEKAEFTADGKPALDEEGIHRWKKTFDDKGNATSGSNFGLDDKPCLYQGQFHRWTAGYDARGNRIEGAVFGIDGVPTTWPEGNHRYTSRYNERGDWLEQSYFGVDGKPCILARTGHHCSGASRATRKLDDRGNILESTYYVLDPKGQYILERRVDGKNNLLEQAHYTSDGRPALNQFGHHRWTARYDERGSRTECSIFGLDNKPAVYPEGNHRFTIRYDDQGRWVEECYFGTDGKPCNLKSRTHHCAGAARSTRKLDGKGRPLETRYWVADPKGKYVLERRVDAENRVVEKAHFSPEGSPRVDENGVHRWIARLDERGNRLEVAAFDPRGEPALLNPRYHRWTAGYDERGKQVERAAFDVKGKPALLAETYHRWTGRYNKAGKPIEEAVFDAQGKAAVHPLGYHKTTSKYDGEGNLVEQLFLGPDEKPATYKKLFARLTMKYDRGRLVESASWLVDSRGEFVLRDRLDAKKRPLELASFTPDGRPTLNEEGVHRWKGRYDASGNLREAFHFDAGGKPTLSRAGFHRSWAQFDEKNNMVEVRYFGVDGKPCRTTRGHAKLVRVFDEKNKLQDTIPYDAEGKQLAFEVSTGKVTPGSAAARAGLEEADVLKRYDGKAITSSAQFLYLRANEGKTEKPRKLEVERKGKPLSVDLGPGTLGFTPKEQASAPQGKP